MSDAMDFTKDLMPCPFCGAKRFGLVLDNSRTIIECVCCGAVGPSCGTIDWNQRWVPQMSYAWAGGQDERQDHHGQ